MIPSPLGASAPKMALTLGEFAFFLGSLHTFKKTHYHVTSLWWANTSKLQLQMESQNVEGLQGRRPIKNGKNNTREKKEKLTFLPSI